MNVSDEENVILETPHISSSLERHILHSDDILGARMLWKPKKARILKNFIDQPV
jgi:hypothetical protein